MRAFKKAVKEFKILRVMVQASTKEPLSRIDRNMSVLNYQWQCLARKNKFESLSSCLSV